MDVLFTGWTDPWKHCTRENGFANDDIFYLEVCLFSQVCHNRHRLFELNAMQPFHCNFDSTGFDHLARLLKRGPVAGNFDKLPPACGGG